MIRDSNGGFISPIVKKFPPIVKSVEASIIESPVKTPLTIFLDNLHEIGKVWYGEHYRIVSTGSYIKFYFRYPEKKISNGRINHTMRDLIICFTFIYNGKLLIFSSANGSRGVLTPGEKAANWGFSHMNGLALANFCYGDGPLYDVMMRKLPGITDWLTMPDYRLFERALVLFDTYLSWESLEGGPYRKLSDIGGEREEKKQFSSSLLETFYLNVALDIKNNPRLLKPVLRAGFFYVDRDFIERYILSSNKEIYRHYEVIVNSRGNEIQNATQARGYVGYSVTFGDETYDATYYSEQEKKELGTKKISTIAMDYFSTKIEKRLNKFIYSEY